MVKFLDSNKELRKIGLKYNPFDSEPLREDEIELMAGREKELEELTQVIGQRNNVLITGQKGIGKTTVLNHLFGRAKKEKLIVARLETPPMSERQFFIQIFKSLLKENKTSKNSDPYNLEKYKNKIDKYENIPVMYAGYEIAEDIKTCAEKNFKKVDYPLLIFVDEFHKIMLSPGMRDIDLIVNLCKHMFDKEFVFVCCSLIKGIRSSYENPSKEALMDRFSATLTLTPLTLSDTKQLINKRIASAKTKDSNFSFSDKVIENIYDYSETPRETIELSKTLLNHHARGNPLDEKEIKYIATYIGFTPMMRLKDELKERQKKIFHALLELNKPTSPTELGSLLHMPISTIIYNLKAMEPSLVTHIGTGSHVKYLLEMEEDAKPIAKQHVTTLDGKPVLTSGPNELIKKSQEKPQKVEIDPQTVIIDSKSVNSKTKEVIKKPSQKESKS